MDTKNKQGSPRVDSPNLKQLALDHARNQWDGKTVYIWGNAKKGAFLKASYNKSTVYLFITDHRLGCPIFVLIDGWIISPTLDRDYRDWVKIVGKVNSKPVPASPVVGLAAKRLAAWRKANKDGR